MELALAVFVSVLISMLVSVGVGYWVVRQILSKKLVEPHVVFEEPPKKRHILVPGEGGVYTVHPKRKCKVTTEEELWLREVDSRSSGQEGPIR